MRSEKLLLLLAGGLLLAGCSDNNDSSVSVTEPATEAVETTAAEVSAEDYKLSADKNGATMLVNGKSAGSMKFDTPLSESEQVLFADVNSDGYDDIFVCLDCFRADCWVYDHEAEKFVSAGEKLPIAFAFDKNRGCSVTCETDSSENAVTVVQISDSNEGSTVFKWQEDKLVPISMSISYYTSDDGPFVYNYGFDDELRKVLTERQLLNGRTGELKKTEKDIEYFRVTDSSVDYMKGAELLQSIEVSGLPEMCGKILSGEYQASYTINNGCPAPVPEGLLFSEYDFDFEGHSDLAIYTDTSRDGSGLNVLYYRYDTASGSYTPWEELNRFSGYQLFTIEDTKEITYFDYSSSENGESDQYILVWADGSLKLTQRRHRIKKNGMYELYEYDAQGNESYVKDVSLPTGSY